MQANETPNDLEFSVENFRNSYGKSAANLVRVRRAGGPVVPWFVLSFDAMSRFLNGHALHEFIAENQHVDGSTAKIEKRFAGCSVTPEIFKVLSTLVFRSRTFKGQSLNLRLCAFDDDDVNPAHLTEPIYNLRSEFEVLIAIRQAWALAFSPKVMAWRKARGLEPRLAKVSVMFQASVDAEVGGTVCARESGVELYQYLNLGIEPKPLSDEIKKQLESVAQQLPGTKLRWAVWGAQLYFLGESWASLPTLKDTTVQVSA